MPQERVHRRLAAILAADVVGYARLVRADEAGTLARLKALRAELVDPVFAKHEGRIVKLMGDGILAEFASVVDAVAAAMEIQHAMAARNLDDPEEDRIAFRVGVNLGDVVIDGDDIQGDGVNVAARLEGLAEPGGICVSGNVYEEVRDRIDAAFADLGEREVKNIDRPVRVWRWSAAPTASTTESPNDTDTLALPEKPSIAVLPFDNMSGDPEQEYFADGITEDLITALSKIRWFFVIARNSTFRYKGQAVDVPELGRELGVRYVLEGSVRKGGNRVRITVQLIDAASGRHVWAERYDRELDDVFALQDEMTETIVRAIEPELGSVERERAMRKSPGNLDAWEMLQRGLWHHYRFTKEDNAQAQVCFRRAIEADPNFAQSLAALAHARYWDALFAFVGDTEAALAEGLEYARKAVLLDDREPFAHFALGRVQSLRGELDAAISALRQAIERNPNFAHAYYGLGLTLVFDGRPSEAVEQIDTAIRLNPRDPSIWTFMAGRSMALLLLRRLEEAVDGGRQSARMAAAGFWAHAVVASALGHLGEERDAAAALADAYRSNPNFSEDFIRSVFRFRVPEDLDFYLDGLRKAGLPRDGGPS
jgi:TolB-like protein